LIERFEAESEDVEQDYGKPGSAKQADHTYGDPWQKDLFGFDAKLEA